MVLIIVLCAMLLLCALNPKMSDSLAAILYGNENIVGIVPTINKWRGVSDKPDGDSAENNDGVNSAIVGAVDGVLEGVTDAVIVVPGGTIIPSDVSSNGGTGGIYSLPTEVAGLVGYIPTSGSGEKIADDVAEAIKSTLSTGETGANLTFDAVMYPYYWMLGDDEKAVYRQIFANAQAVNSSFAPVKPISAAQLQNVFEAVVNDHPELFYLDTAYSVKYTQAGSVVEIQLAYYTLVNDLPVAKQKFADAANAILASATVLSNDYEKEKYVHDVLLTKIEYVNGAALSQSAYSALVNGKTVCAGYARANQYLLQQLGIPCYYCTGYSGEDHAWNIVMLDDGFYNEDTTWDDTNPSTYDYFNRSDAAFAGTHQRTSLSVNLPACNGSLYAGPINTVANNAQPGNAADYVPHSEMEPLRYDEEYPETPVVVPGNSSSGNNASQTEEAIAAALRELGLAPTDVIWSLDDYYKDCNKKLTAAGTGDQHFVNIVPAELFDKIVSDYGTGAYEKGYVEDVLVSLGMDHFTIQIQAQKLGKGYYKLFHNVVTWKE